MRTNISIKEKNKNLLKDQPESMSLIIEDILKGVIEGKYNYLKQNEEDVATTTVRASKELSSTASYIAETFGYKWLSTLVDKIIESEYGDVQERVQSDTLEGVKKHVTLHNDYKATEVSVSLKGDKVITGYLVNVDDVGVYVYNDLEQQPLPHFIPFSNIIVMTPIGYPKN